MSCLDENTALALVDGLLSPPDAASAHAHVADCSDCRRVLSALAADPVFDGGSKSKTVNLGAASSPDTLFSGAAAVAGSDSDEAAHREPGAQIGRYEIIKRLGWGGMGSVFLAEDLELHRKVAIKLMHSSTPRAAERLLHEARSMAKLRHPNVATVYDVGREDDDVYVAMEYISGKTLRQWLETDHSIAARLKVAAAAGRGLAAAHDKGLVHRDFKPDNVMVGDDGRVQVLDFGLAKAAGPSLDDDDASVSRTPTLTQTGALVGTPAYMAPEQFALQATDARSDQFAFCTVLYEAIHDERPFAGETLEELAESVCSGELKKQPANPAISAEVSAAIAQGLSVRPSDRFPTMAPLLKALTAASPRRRSRRSRILIAAALAVAVASAALIARRSMTRGDADDPMAALLSASELPELRRQPAAGDPLGVTVHRLANGLTIFVSPQHTVPRVAAHVVVRAGSRDDPVEKSGVAHLAERMMYSGTESLGTSNYAAELVLLAKLRSLIVELSETRDPDMRTSLRAAIDATSAEAAKFAIPDEFRLLSQSLGVEGLRSELGPTATIFSAEMPSERFAQWAMLEGERWARPVARLFDAEVGKVVAARRSRESAASPPTNLGELARRHLYRSHPYGRHPRGAFADLNDELLPLVETFMATRYTPNNAALVLAGDIDIDAALPILEKAFAGWKPRALAKHPHTPPPEASAEIDDVDPDLRYAGILAQESPSWSPRDAVKVVFKRLLNSPELFAEPQALGSVVGTRFEIERHRDARAWFVFAQPEAGQSLTEAIGVVDRRLEAIESGAYDERHIAGILERFHLRQGATNTENSVRGKHIADAYAAGVAWPARYYVNVSDTVSKDDVRELARRLRTTKRTVLRVEQTKRAIDLPPFRSRPPLPTARGQQSEFAKRLLATKSAQRPMRFVWPGRDYEIRQTRSGELVSVANPDDQIFEVVLVWRIGWRRSPQLCLGLWALEFIGVGELSVDERKRQWARELFSATVACHRDKTTVTMRGHIDHIDNVSVALELLRGDQLSDETLAAVVQRFRSRKPEEVALEANDAATEFAVFGNASHFLAAPSSQTLAAMRSVEVKAALAQLLGSRRTTLYFAPMSSPEKGVIDSFIGSEGPELAPTPLVPPLPVLQPTRPRIVFHDLGGGRDTAVAVFYIMRRLPEERVAALQLLDAYAELRLKSMFRGIGLEASVGSGLFERGEDGGLLKVGFSASGTQAHDKLRSALTALNEPPMTQQELDSARTQLEARYISEWIEPRELTGRIAQWRYRGHEGDPRPARYAALKRLGIVEMRAFVDEVTSSPMAIVVVGDLASVDRGAFKRLGDVIEVELEDLFVP